MTLDNWTGLLRLMSLMVIIDGRVRVEEVRVFEFRMMELHRRTRSDLMISKRMVTDWFDAHSDEIAALDARGRAEFLNQTLSMLGSVPKKTHLLDAIAAVARADGERHPAEIALLRDLAGRWNVRLTKAMIG